MEWKPKRLYHISQGHHKARRRHERICILPICLRGPLSTSRITLLGEFTASVPLKLRFWVLLKSFSCMACLFLLVLTHPGSVVSFFFLPKPYHTGSLWWGGIIGGIFSSLFFLVPSESSSNPRRAAQNCSLRLSASTGHFFIGSNFSFCYLRWFNFLKIYLAFSEVLGLWKNRAANTKRSFTVPLLLQMHKCFHYQNPAPECCTCCKWWTYTDTLLLSKVDSLH